MSRLAHRVGSLVQPTCKTESSALCLGWRAGRNKSGSSKHTVERQDTATSANNPPATHLRRRRVATARGCLGTPVSVPWNIPGQVRGQHGARDFEQAQSRHMVPMKVYLTTQAPQDKIYQHDTPGYTERWTTEVHNMPYGRALVP